MNHDKGYLSGHSYYCLEPLETTALYGDGTQNGGDDRGNVFEDFSHFSPVDFYHRFVLVLVACARN